MLSSKQDSLAHSSISSSFEAQDPLKYAKNDAQDEALSKLSTNVDSKASASCKFIGEYCIRQTLGSGTFSKTKLGIHKKTGQQVAIKILKPNLSETALKTILTEINALKAINSHKHVI